MLVMNQGAVESRFFDIPPNDNWKPLKRTPKPQFNVETEDCVEISPLITETEIITQWQIIKLAERKPKDTTLHITEPILNNELYIPKVVSLRQFRMALKRVGLFSKIDELKNSPYLNQTQKDDLTEFLEYSNTIERNHPLIQAFAPMLGVTSEQIDQVFQLADTL